MPCVCGRRRLLIALLMAGQHTSSTTSSWFGFYMTKYGYQDALFKEQETSMGASTDPISVEDLNQMPLLHACVRETLRLKPPIMQMMRKVRKEFTVKAGGKEYVIPAGNQVAVSPSVNGRNPDEWSANHDLPINTAQQQHLDSRCVLLSKQSNWIPAPLVPGSQPKHGLESSIQKLLSLQNLI